MNLDWTEEQELLRDAFAQLLAGESSCERVLRAAEATGFDPQLWKHLVEVGALGVRVHGRAGAAAALVHREPEARAGRGRDGEGRDARGGVAAALDDGALEFGYRLATAFAIYGGTAEIPKSIVAQSALGMPRSRG